MSQLQDLSSVISAMETYESGVFTEVVNLKDLSYNKDGEFGTVRQKGRNYALTQWSMRSLCSRLRLPSGYMKSASERLVNESVSEFAALLDKGHDVGFVVHKNPTTGDLVLRGCVDAGRGARNSSTPLKAIYSVLGNDVGVEHATLDMSNHAAVHRTRLLWPNSLKNVNGDEVGIGLDLLSSDVDIVPEQINILLYRTICTNGLVALYGHRPYLYIDHKKTSIFDYDGVAHAISQRAVTDTQILIANVERAMNTIYTAQQTQDTLTDLDTRKLLPHSFVVKSLRTAEQLPPATLWDFTNILTAQAKGYRDDLRLKYEQVAGSVAGINFDRNKLEDDYAKKFQPIPQLPASVAVIN